MWKFYFVGKWGVWEVSNGEDRRKSLNIRSTVLASGGEQLGNKTGVFTNGTSNRTYTELEQFVVMF